MLARNSLLEEAPPSISTATNVGARSWSRALVSLASMAWFQAFSRPRTRPPSSLAEFCANAVKAAAARKAAAAVANFFMETPRRLRNAVAPEWTQDKRREDATEEKEQWSFVGSNLG